MESYLAFDIETAPFQADQVYELSKPFDESTVAVGNLKDESKKAAKIEIARIEHHQKLLANATLDARVSRVCCISLATDKHEPRAVLAGELDEKQLIEQFWQQFRHTTDRGGQVLGYYCCSFDLPFLQRRSWLLGIPTPRLLDRARWWRSDIVDLIDRWRVGDWRYHISLDLLSRAFGLPGKLEGCTGDRFYQVLKRDPELAKRYACRDVELVVEIAKRMGII